MRRALAALLTVPLLAACGGEASGGELSAVPVDPPFQVSSAPLEATDGESYSLTGSTDKPLTLVFFGYTHCPDICAAVMSTLASAMTRLDERDRDRVDVLFVTTDPARDDVPTLKRYLAHFDPSFIGLTGELGTIVQVGKPLGVGVTHGQKLPSGGYDVTHGTTITAIDADDEAPYFWHQDTSSAQFATDIHRLLEES